MTKLTKKYLMEEALNKYSIGEIDKAKEVEVIVVLKDGKIIKGLYHDLSRKRKISKSEYILKEIRSLLMNIKPTEENKRNNYNTSSNNIESIKINLKFK